MEVLSTMLTFIPLSFLCLFLGLCFMILKGKSIGNSNYAPCKGTVFNQLLHFKKLHDYHTELAKTNPTFRLLTPDQSELYTVDTRNVEHILKTKFDKYSKGKYNQDVLSDLFGEGIFAVDGEKWRQQRKLASYEFSTRVLRDFSCSVFRRNASKLVRVLSEFSHRGVAFDLQDLLMRSALDSICEVGFGTELNCLEESSKEGVEFMKAFDESNALIYWRYVDPFWKIKRFLNIGSEATLKKKIKLMDDFVHGVIKARKAQLAVQQEESSNVKEDILSRFLMESKKDPKTMTDKYLRDIIMNFMLAGKDSSANTLTWFFYMLCKNPLLQEKIAQEVRDNVTCYSSHEGEENIDEFVSNLTDDTIDKMHYLHAALTETLRLYPAVPLDAKICFADDILPDGYNVNKGDMVSYQPYAMGRMKFIWGDDAEEFRPERWLDHNGIFQPDSPFRFTAFQAGPRICLGKEFAYRQMKIFSAVLLGCFRFELSDETKVVTYKTMINLHIDGGLEVKAFHRDWD
ncbi:hypothetical protein AHAS_Ahas02G0231400 [Arachis hypogaea]